MECAPKNCAILEFSMLTPAQKREQRKAKAEQLYKQGFTEQQIAYQFGVSTETVSQDLKTFSGDRKMSERGKDTLGRKKSTGRPKGSTKRAAPTPHKKQDQVEALMDQGMTMTEIAARTGVGKRQVRHIVERVEIEREVKNDPEIARSELSMSAQEKLDAAIRQHKRKLDLAFESRVAEEVRRRIDEMILPHWRKQVDQAKELYKHRRGAMDKATFNKIRRALHPDSRHSISDTTLAAAFDTFMGLEKFLLNENDSPTDLSGIPDSLAEWDKMRAKPNRKSNSNIARR